MITKETLFAVMCGALAFGCSTGPTPAEERQEIISNLVQAGFQADAITVAGGKVYLGGDIHVTLEASRERIEPAGPGPEHYRTSNLVSGKTLICINPTASFSSIAALSAGLDFAIDNYNALPLVFDFRRGPSTTCDANITIAAVTSTGGAGFPSGGNPYPYVYIPTGVISYGINVIEHVITHEIGHSIGMCHTDGGGSGGGVGCSFILGTPTVDPNSIFNTNFMATSTGEFTGGDAAALNILY